MLPGAFTSHGAQAKAPVERQPLQPKAKRLDVGRSVAAGADSDGDRADEPCTKDCHCVSSLVDKATELEDALEDERSAHALTSSLLKEAADKKSGASAQGGRGGGRPPKKIGTGAAPPKRKNTERRRKMTKVHCAPPEALGAPRPRARLKKKLRY